MVPICKTCSNELSFFKKEAELEGGVLPEECRRSRWSSSAAKAALSAQTEEMDRTVKGLQL